MAKKWSKGVKVHEGELTSKGYHIHESEEKRHAALKRSIKEDGYATTVRRINYLHNVTDDPATKRATESDLKWLEAEHKRDPTDPPTNDPPRRGHLHHFRERMHGLL